MTPRRVPLYDPLLVNIAAYLTLGAVAISGLLALETSRSRWIAGVLLVTFGILVTVQVVQEMLTEVGVGTAGKSDGA